MSSIFLYGRPGSGKSTLAASMTKLGYKVLFIDVDNKINKMYNLKSLLESGMIRAIPITSRLVETPLGERFKELSRVFELAKSNVKVPAQKKQPGGYLEYCDIITHFEEEMAAGNKPEEQVLVTDSFTSLQEHMKRLVLYIQKQDKFTYDEWEIWKTNLEEFMNIHLRLQGYFKHIIIISHEMMEKDELIGKIEILPAIEGSMRHKIGKNFEEIYHTFVDVPKSGAARYKVATKPMDRAEGRTSRALSSVEEADFSILFADELSNKAREQFESLRQPKAEEEELNEEAETLLHENSNLLELQKEV